MTRGILEPGKADWEYDDYWKMHIPCCTSYVILEPVLNVLTFRKCRNGPLTGINLFTGDCGEHGEASQSRN